MSSNLALAPMSSGSGPVTYLIPGSSRTEDAAYDDDHEYGDIEYEGDLNGGIDDNPQGDEDIEYEGDPEEDIEYEEEPEEDIGDCYPDYEDDIAEEIYDDGLGLSDPGDPDDFDYSLDLNSYEDAYDEELDSPPPQTVTVTETVTVTRTLTVDPVCIICYDRDADTILLPCRHLNFCRMCCDSLQLFGRDHAGPRAAMCPICRQVVLDRITVFRG